MHIGILGGMFDPIHFGHLRAALEAQESAVLDRVHFIPCAHPPHRHPTIASFAQRCAMVTMAIADHPTFQLDTRESERAGPSYMVDTLRSLQDSFPHATLSLILGADAFSGIAQWHQWHAIPELAQCIVLTRGNTPRPHISKEISVHLHEMCPLTISSTMIRHTLQQGKSPQYLLPTAVLRYIEAKSLYGATKNIDKSTNNPL